MIIIPKTRFQIYKDEIGDWRFRLMARNNQIISSGQGYENKQNVLKGIKSIRANAPKALIENLETGETIEELKEIEPVKEDEKIVSEDAEIAEEDEKIVSEDAEIDQGEQAPEPEKVYLTPRLAYALFAIAIILAISSLVLSLM